MNIARIKRRRRILFLLLGFSALSISGTLILLATRDSIIYFYSPTELLNKNNIENKLIRIGGLVKTGTLKRLRAKKQYIKPSQALRIKKQKAVYSAALLRDME